MDPHPYATGVPDPLRPGQGAGSSRARWIALVLLVDALFVAAGIGWWGHNRMLGRAEGVEAAWSQVESNLQRRADLVPRLVESIDRYLRHESELTVAVARARSAAAVRARETASELERARAAGAAERAALGGAAPGDAAALAALSRSETAVAEGVRALLAVAEGYPELRSADQFLELQAQLEGSENRINVARMAYNDAVRDYNAALVQLPTRWFAGDLERRPYFEADAGARVARPLAFE